jgi:hypothetical protein
MALLRSKYKDMLSKMPRILASGLAGVLGLLLVMIMFTAKPASAG